MVIGMQLHGSLHGWKALGYSCLFDVWFKLYNISFKSILFDYSIVCLCSEVAMGLIVLVPVTAVHCDIIPSAHLQDSND